MKRNALALLVLAGLGGAATAAWVPVSEDSDTVVYYDPATLERTADAVTVWEMSDYKRMATTVNDHFFRSAKTQRQYDCALGNVRTVSVQPFEGQMGDGRPLDENIVDGDWEAVVSGSPREPALKLVCGG